MNQPRWNDRLQPSPGRHRTAALDGQVLSNGSFVFGELNGELVAAAPIDASAKPLGDPRAGRLLPPPRTPTSLDPSRKRSLARECH